MSIVKTIFSVILTIAVVGVASFVGYVAYSIYLDIKKTTEAKMKKNNVTWTKDGMKVGVKEVSAEKQIDKTQKVLSDAWKYAQQDKLSPPSTPTGETSGRKKSEERPKPVSRTQSTPLMSGRTLSSSSK